MWWRMPSTLSLDDRSRFKRYGGIFCSWLNKFEVMERMKVSD